MSPGIDPVQSARDRKVLEKHEGSPKFYSTGRGGAGNIRTPEHSKSRSRSRGAEARIAEIVAGAERSVSRGRAKHSTGRGGAGNITGETLHEEGPELDAYERRAYSPTYISSSNPIHSTGRGGLANVTALASPPIEYADGGVWDGTQGNMMVSTGRGGVGNIRERTRSASRGGGPRSVERTTSRGGVEGEHSQQGVIGKIMDRVKGRGGGHPQPGGGGGKGEELLDDVESLARSAK
ncbi:uncharacterized protein FOMMEDRAFT_18497 [Fomitiporia mediterranea MF3/22]|uniref:uncharacterized protein n=1 Tax=Fomitiporia mediterranea (strain MF3/22) TaxID=694068 RepID=UPI0004408968|nr:uncharacterized protein FOMMEDRAFT_18497 [Fomitiporia mediterranea MF3/22]EJD04711.1 hypothetical protein FOMMEDRAFT_18497 [Fomitiporia mediterranea MF3/22]